MAMHLHDTLTRSKVEVVPLDPGHVRMYTCGPTVYNRAHIGNFRTYVFEDVLRRWLERRFDRVTHVMNLTDVEDKIIRNAAARGQTVEQETEPWIAAFFEDVETLNIRRAHAYPRATRYIGEMVEVIGRLTERGLTYTTGGSVYFKIAKFPHYGRLSGTQGRHLISGASGRIDADEYDKDEARDFALWKAVGPDDIGWDTSLGRGRPGWHIECSAMSMKLLGESFDIHCGGVDNIFPHHENEIAQSEGSTGKPFVQLWCHSAHLRVEDEKMSKSLGNVVTLGDLVRGGAQPSAIRYTLAATAHHSKPMNYSADAVEASRAAIDRVVTFRDRVRSVDPTGGDNRDQVAAVDDAWAMFGAAMDDDLNVSGAMSAVFDVIREGNRALDSGSIPVNVQQRLLTFIDDMDDVLGIVDLADRERSMTISDEVRALLEERVAARAARDWRRSDALRRELSVAGVAVEDTPQGQRWKRVGG